MGPQEKIFRSHRSTLRVTLNVAQPNSPSPNLRFFKMAAWRLLGIKLVPHPIPQAPRCPESNVLDMSVFNWLQQCVDSAEVVTRDEIKAETLRAWKDMPESVVLNSFNHLQTVHKTIVELNGFNNTNQ